MVKIAKSLDINDKQPGENISNDVLLSKCIGEVQAGEADYGAEANDIERRTIFIGDIPYSTDENQLRAIFGAFGSIESAHIKRDKITKKHLGYGFITFSTRSEALAAFDQRSIGEHEIRVGWARKNQTLVISNPAAAGGLEEILAHVGCRDEVHSTYFSEGGHCTIRFLSRQAAEHFRKKANGMVIAEGRDPCRISWSNTNFNNVHIHFGKDHSITVQDLLAAFSRFGPVEKIVLPQTETGESKGFGFVYYPYGEKGERSAAEAIQTMNGATLRNGSVPIICNYGHRARARPSLSRSISRSHALNQMEGETSFDSEYLNPGSVYSSYPYYDGNQMLIIPATYMQSVYPMIHAAIYQAGMAPSEHDPMEYISPGSSPDNEGQ